MTPEPIPTIKVGRYRLTPHFAARLCKHYARRITKGEMPTEIHAGLQSPDSFGANVNAKAEYLLKKIGAPVPPAAGGEWSDVERALHAATVRIAEHYGFGALPLPRLPEPPKPEEPPQSGGEEGEGKSKKAKPDGESEDSDSDSDGDGESEGQDQGEPEKADGEPQDGDGEADGDDSQQEQGEGDEGEQDGDADSEGDGEGEGQPGEAKPDGESEDSDSDSDGEGAANEGPPDGGDAGMDPTSGGKLRDGPPAELNLDQHLPELQSRDVDVPKFEVSPLTPETEWYNHGVDTTHGAQLLSRVREELMSVSRHRYSRDKDSGDVDFTKLVDLAQGTNLDRVFYTMTHAKRLSAAVQILLDASGSMGYDAGSRSAASCQLGYMLATVLEKLRVPCQILSCTGYPYLVKDWHEKVSACRVLEVTGHGGNHLPACMERCVPILARRREQKLIQVITTDGDVGWSSKKTQDFYKEMPMSKLPGESDARHSARICGKAYQRMITDNGGYRGDGHDHGNRDAYGRTIPVPELEARLAKLYRENPRLTTYAFGIQIDIPPFLFHRAFNALQPENMTEVIVETLGRVLSQGR